MSHKIPHKKHPRRRKIGSKKRRDVRRRRRLKEKHK